MSSFRTVTCVVLFGLIFCNSKCFCSKFINFFALLLAFAEVSILSFGLEAVDIALVIDLTCQRTYCQLDDVTIPEKKLIIIFDLERHL